jgi:hypothetical protein
LDRPRRCAQHLPVSLAALAGTLADEFAFKLSKPTQDDLPAAPTSTRPKAKDSFLVDAVGGTATGASLPANAGRPCGSKNRTTAIAQALLVGEEPELVSKSIELAKAGDVQMLKFLLDRLLPKERLIKIDIPPLDFADDAINGMAAITGAIAEGQITPSEGAAIASMVGGYSRTLEVAELSKRVEALEASLKLTNDPYAASYDVRSRSASHPAA